MTKREKEIFNTVKELSRARPKSISEKMGISPDYAEQLCRDMVWMGYFLKKGLGYKLAPRKEFE